MITQTPSQTVGPFFHYGLIHGGDENMVTDLTKGQRILVTGNVYDGDGELVQDAMLEVWQADVNGYFNHPADPNYDKADKNFRGIGRSGTVTDGQYLFKTIKPGAVAAPDGTLYAPHLSVHVFGRGMLIHAYTRFYFSDEAEANQNDAILNLIDPERRSTMIMQLQENEDLPTYRLDVILQGEGETVFFDMSK